MSESLLSFFLPGGSELWILLAMLLVVAALVGIIVYVAGRKKR